MTDAVETMAWVDEKPWHGLGEQVASNLSAKEMMKKAGCDWGVEKRPIYVGTSVDSDRGTRKVPGSWALCRDNDGSVLDIVGNTYKPVQNADAFDFFKKFVDAGHMQMHTAGSLCKGQYIWALAKVDQELKIGSTRSKNPDTVESYLLLVSPHKLGRKLMMLSTAIRVVCWNTLQLALGAANESEMFKFAHVREFDDSVKAEAEETLGLVQSGWRVFAERAKELSMHKITADETEEFFFKVLRVDPNDLETNEDGEQRLPRAMKKFQDALTYAPGHDLSGSDGTWWGALNAVTYVVDHKLGRDRNTALRSAWLGGKAGMKRRAYNFALQGAGIVTEDALEQVNGGGEED